MANESATAVSFLRAVLDQCRLQGFRSLKFFVVLDHASSDNTLELLRQQEQELPEVQVVWAPENRSVADAYVRGYREALKAGCDWILEIDAGFSHDPADIPQFFAKITEGYVCVFGSRFCKGGSVKKSSLSRQLISRGGSLVSNLLLGTRLTDMTSGFEMFSRPVLQVVLERGVHSRGPFFQTEIKTYCRNFAFVEVPIQYQAASHNVNKAALKDAFANLWRLFRLRISGRL